MPAGVWSDLLDLSPEALLDRLLTNVDELVVVSNDPEVEDRSLAALPRPLQIVYVLNWLDYEVCQGSLVAYAFNPRGRHARLAADGLREIGAHRLASVVSRAADLLDEHRAVWNERHAEIDDGPEFAVATPFRDLAGTDELDRLTDEYHEIEEVEAWPDLLEAYLAIQARSLHSWAIG